MVSLALMVQKEILADQVHLVIRELQESLAYQVHLAELESLERKATVECQEYLA